MIVLDIETSGGNALEHGVWQIGAIDLNTMEEFLEEGKIDDEDVVSEEALRIIGKTEEELRDKTKQSQKQLLEKFFNWFKTRKMKNLLCHLPSFDHGFLKIKAKKYFNTDPFWPDYHRTFDLHSIAQVKFFELNRKFLINDNNHSDMGLRNILKMCGIEDKRKGRETEGTPHNALEDCKLEGECFSRIVYGKNLFPEYDQFKIPEELTK